MTGTSLRTIFDRDGARPGGRAGMLRGFVIGLACFTATFALSAVFREFLRPHVFLFFFTGVAFSAWLGGFWPAILASVLSVLAADYLFFPPPGIVAAEASRSLVSLFFFLVLSGLISSITARLRRTRERAEARAAQEERARAGLLTALEALPVGVWFTDETGRIVYGNPEGRRIWGGAAFVGPEQFEEYRGWRPETGRRIEADEWAVARVIRERTAVLGEEIEIEAFDGTRRFIRNSAVPIHDRGGRFLGAAVLNEDITTRKAVERSLRQTTDTLSAIIRASPLAIIALDLDARIEAWNPAAERMFGWTEAEVVGRPTPIVPEERRSEVAREFELAARGEVFTGLETERIRKDGRRVDVSVSTAPVRGTGGEIRGVMVLFEDITERKRAEESQRFLSEVGRVLTASLDYRETLRAVARLAVPAIADECAVDVLDDGRLHRVAVAYADPAGAVLGRTLDRRWSFDPASDSIVARVLRTGEPELVPEAADEILRGMVEDEEHYRVLKRLGVGSALVVPLTARGRVLGAVILTAGESRRRFDREDLATAEELAMRAGFAVDNARLFAEAQEARAEAERRAREETELRAALEVVMESRERLVRGFSHDLKNPLGAADGHLQLLEEGIVDGLTPKQRESVGRARSSIAAALRLIDDLVELARAEAGRIEIERRHVEIGALVREAAEEFRAPAEAKGLDLVVRIEPDLSPIESDPARIRQVLGNLLSNATKYTDEGTITVRTGIREGGGAPGAGRWVAVEVRDTGPGIPADQHRRLFQEFVRLRPETGRGAGLGLAISQRIAALLGGTITLESEVGEGSTFTLWLPGSDGAGRRRAGAGATTAGS